MPSPVSPPARAAAPPERRRQRADGAQARRQLLLAALRLFAEKGYAKTSTREIAQAAGANVAAISYYFGDKAQLYRSVFTELLENCDDLARYQPAHLSLRQALEGFIAGFLEPLKQGNLAQQLTRLHFREMLEPSGLWADAVSLQVAPAHTALVGVLARHLGMSKADDDLHRLAFSITGLAMQVYVSRDVIDSVRPRLIATPRNIDLWADRLADFAEALVAVEAARRRQAAADTPKKP
jgi:AcrR family transcriptional regulator